METKRLSTTLPASYLDALRAEAEGRGVSTAEVVRRALAESLGLDFYRLPPGRGSRPQPVRSLVDLM